MSSYVVEGKAMWSHLLTPFDTFGNDCYQIYISADDKTMLRFADKGVDVKSVNTPMTLKSLQSKLQHEQVMVIKIYQHHLSMTKIRTQ